MLFNANFFKQQIMTITESMADDDKDSLPEMVLSKEFNSKYHVYEVLGKLD